MPDLTPKQRKDILGELSAALNCDVTKLKYGTSHTATVAGVEVTVTRSSTFYQVVLRQSTLSGSISIYTGEADHRLDGAGGVRLAQAVQQHLPRLLAAVIGEEKAAWLANYAPKDEAATIPLTGFGGVDVENPAVSLECPPGFFDEMAAACTTLLQTATGKKIIQLANTKGVSFTIFYQKGKFNYGCDSDDPMQPVQRGKFFADPGSIRVESAYKGVEKVPVDDEYPLTVAQIRIAVVFAHEVVHAIHSMVDWAAYVRRGNTPASDDWSNEEEQLTITGWLKDTDPWEVSECHLLHDLGLPPRWGHGDATTIHRDKITAQQVAERYGGHWGKSYAV